MTGNINYLQYLGGKIRFTSSYLLFKVQVPAEVALL